ncbi:MULTISPECIES: Lrp/AsnC family transcriptional regulator [Halomonas]|uniref:AsnC family transcriptional regulator n=1 Tax=Halomonas halophila TaxID=29573 RepID=A0ABQ0U0B2_9GAMM|nr:MULTISPECIES: Lrp/AsnC family transcriptional regulator [Halomonas]MDR5888660.1 Lrp/AsnC family transcriptional regulator [Halomonas salina]PSJ22423.1 AsnC family transcriptional regulator [Halomonas sp. ND22Bw]WJY07841.1 Lrp/AsnC family transcriptional regulator [Halomonas halophila]GEK71978.1 AsnC family transcriptional regulator [Halomonas halophila]
MTTLDRFDLALLHALQRDARLTLGALSEAVSLSPSQCSRRLARLERDGIIQGYALRLDPRALGLAVTAFISISMDKSRMDRPLDAVAALLARDEVIECHTITGDHDFVLKVVVESLGALSAFLAEAISPLEGIQNVATQVAMDTLKSNGPLKLG